MAYQPIYALDADTPCMAEALLRLCGADGTPVPTADVVSVAEEMDLIVALDWMMLEQVCAFFGAHRELDGCAVSAVSYTHLDVYKRQGLDYIALRPAETPGQYTYTHF